MSHMSFAMLSSVVCFSFTISGLLCSFGCYTFFLSLLWCLVNLLCRFMWVVILFFFNNSCLLMFPNFKKTLHTKLNSLKGQSYFVLDLPKILKHQIHLNIFQFHDKSKVWSFLF